MWSDRRRELRVVEIMGKVVREGKTMNINSVVGSLCSVIDENIEKMKIIFQFSGGWEIWLQCEMVCRYEPGEVLREQSLWGDRRACDLVFENGYAVELKCPGLLRLQTSKKHGGMTFGSTKGGMKSLAEDIAIDQEKIYEYTRNQIGKGGCSLVVIAGVKEFDKLVTYLVTNKNYSRLLNYKGVNICAWQS